MSTLEELSTRALSNDPSQPSIEYDGRWIGWGEMRQVADRVNNLIDASGADPKAPVALIPRNRPHTLAALIGLTARPRHISMIHVYQAPVGIARDIVRLKPAVVVAAAEDMSDEVRSVLAAHASLESRSAGWMLPQFPAVNSQPPCVTRRPCVRRSTF